MFFFNKNISTKYLSSDFYSLRRQDYLLTSRYLTCNVSTIIYLLDRTIRHVTKVVIKILLIR